MNDLKWIGIRNARKSKFSVLQNQGMPRSRWVSLLNWTRKPRIENLWEFGVIWGPWSWGTPASESPRDCGDVCWKLFSGLFALHMMQVQTTPSRANNGSEMISYICINDQHRSWMCILDIQLLSTSTANYKNPNSLVKWESDSRMKVPPLHLKSV